MNKTIQQINKILSQMRPAIQMDGGDLEFGSFKKGVLKLKIKGACLGCPFRQMTFNQGIGETLKEKIKEVKEVIFE
jgi:NFU1 iron-sulfur cluster scaffold homolog, mitochondrial